MVLKTFEHWSCACSLLIACWHRTTVSLRVACRMTKRRYPATPRLTKKWTYSPTAYAVTNVCLRTITPMRLYTRKGSGAWVSGQCVTPTPTVDMYARYVPDGGNEEKERLDNGATNDGPALFTREPVRSLGYIHCHSPGRLGGKKRTHTGDLEP